MVDIQKGFIAFSCPGENGNTKGLVGANYDALIDAVSEIRDTKVAMQFYLEFKSYLSHSEYEKLRDIILKSGTVDEIFKFYEMGELSEAEAFSNAILSSKNYDIILRFAIKARDFINCEDFEDALINCDKSNSGSMLLELAKYPRFNRTKILQELLRIRDTKSIISYYEYYRSTSSIGLDLETIADMAIESKSPHTIYSAAKCIAESGGDNEQLLRKLEEAFILNWHQDPLWLYEYIRYVSCFDKDKLAELCISYDRTGAICPLYKRLNTREKKKLYLRVLKSGKKNVIKELERDEIPLFNVILWRIFRF